MSNTQEDVLNGEYKPIELAGGKRRAGRPKKSSKKGSKKLTATATLEARGLLHLGLFLGLSVGCLGLALGCGALTVLALAFLELRLELHVLCHDEDA